VGCNAANVTYCSATWVVTLLMLTNHICFLKNPKLGFLIMCKGRGVEGINFNPSHDERAEKFIGVTGG
jgi:hypothetical protein